MIDLSESRKKIDEIDRQLVELFERRMKVSADVAEYKKRTGMPVLDQGRERAKLQTLGAMASNDFNRHGIEELFTQIMSMSRKLQYARLHASFGEKFRKVDSLQKKDARIIFFGEKGSYSEQAMKEYFGEEKIVPVYIQVEDGERLLRAVAREQKEAEPKYAELCRRFLADEEDFSEERLQRAGVEVRFENIDLEKCLKERERIAAAPPVLPQIVRKGCVVQDFCDSFIDMRARYSLQSVSSRV